MSEEVPGYVLLEVVGTGAHSTVHRARRTDRAGRIVAIKRLHADAADEAVARLQREAEVLESLQHPAIVPLLDVVALDDGGVALVFPYAPGGSLEDVLVREGTLPWERVADLGARLASALSAAHGAGVLHRDVKPANVLLGVEEEPRLADFGTVVLRDGEHLLDDGVVLGTAEYVDPAVVVDGQDPGPRSDLYGLAVLLYRSLSGQLPHAGGTPSATVAAADRGVHAPLRDLTDAPDELVDAVERALSRQPADRHGAVQQLGAVLDGLARRAEDDRLRHLADQLGDGPDTSGPGDGTGGTGGRDAADAGPPLTSADVPPPTDTPVRRGTAPPPAELPEHPAPPPPPTGGADSGTRLFGPRPSEGAEPPSSPSSTRRWAVPAIVAVVLVPVLVLAGFWVLGGDGGPSPGPSPSLQAREAPARCDGVPDPEGDGEVLDADVAGRGCSLPLLVSREEVQGEQEAVLTVPDAAGDAAGRYVVADAADQVVVGDWNCDGTDTPGVYRPGDGSVYLYDGYGPLEPDTATPLAPDGRAHVVTDAQGCDQVVLADDDAALVRTERESPPGA